VLDGGGTAPDNSTIRPDFVDKVLRILRADAVRGGGRVAREDVERQCFRRNLGVMECLNVESTLLSEGALEADDATTVAARTSSSDVGADGERTKDFLDEVGERELGRKIQLWLRARQSGDAGDDEYLGRLRQDAEAAQARFVLTNVRWVKQTAGKLANTKHLDEEDLFQEGILGLIKSTELWEPELGFRFKTYAGWWINQRMRRAIADTDRTVRLPVHVSAKVTRIRRISNRIEASTGREPSVDALAEILGMDKERLVKLLAVVQLTECLEGDAAHKQSADSDAPTTYLGLVADRHTASPFDIAYENELIRLIQKHLSKRSALIIMWRLGLGAFPQLTLEEIGEKFRLTRERVRQIESKALGRLQRLLGISQSKGQTDSTKSK
jgi:RNA polymerase primary sigma factor